MDGYFISELILGVWMVLLFSGSRVLRTGASGWVLDEGLSNFPVKYHMFRKLKRRKLRPGIELWWFRAQQCYLQEMI
jgi:hypothetical protein